MSNPYVRLHRLLRRGMSVLRAIDLRHRGARVGSDIEIAGRIEIRDANGLSIGKNVRIGSYVRIIFGGGINSLTVTEIS